jgi:glutamate synthase domain-containing protein 3
LAGDAGYALEKFYGAWMAGAIIYQRSRPGVAIPDFYASDSVAMADIKKHAAQQAQAAA